MPDHAGGGCWQMLILQRFWKFILLFVLPFELNDRCFARDVPASRFMIRMLQAATFIFVL